MKQGRKLCVAAAAAVAAAEAVMAAGAAAMAVVAAGAAAAVVAAAETVETAETAGKKAFQTQSGVFIPRDAAGNLPSKFSEIVVCLPAALSLATFSCNIWVRSSSNRPGQRWSVKSGQLLKVVCTSRVRGGAGERYRQRKCTIGCSFPLQPAVAAPLTKKSNDS